MSEHSDPAKSTPPPVDRMSSLWRRVNEHKLVQWSVAYVAFAFGVQHGVTLTVEALEWPHAVERASLLLLALGLPVVMTLAWYHGARASRRISGPELSILSALLVIGAFLFYTFAQPSENIAAAPSSGTQQANIASGTVGISLAVLPFANMSGDASQEFFSDGMTEEINGVLAKVPDLHVIARTSAFQFKGQSTDVRSVGKSLGATHLIEGSVRKAGDRVRITAQLVRAGDGVQLWSENYDRNLTDIFAIQEDIAQAIAASLRVPLGLQQGESLVRSRTKDDANYEDYLRARGLYRARGYQRLVDSSKLLEQVVAREPDYAPAWALLALDDFFIPIYHPAYLSGDFEQVRPVIDTYLPKAEAAAQRAIQLDPKSPEGYSALELVQFARGNMLQAAELGSRALALDPDNPDSLHIYGALLANLGYIKQALPMRRRLQALEPFVPIFADLSAEIMYGNGYGDEALALLQTFPKERVSVYLAAILASQGRYREAADALSASPAETYLPGTVKRGVDLLRAAPAPAAPSALGQLGLLGVAVYPYIGAADRLLDAYEGARKVGLEVTVIIFFWTKPFESVRQTDRFKAFFRNAGYVDYWKAKGWPDLCHPVGADDFVCD